MTETMAIESMTELTKSQALEMATELAAGPTMAAEETSRLIITKMVRAADEWFSYGLCFCR